MSDTQLIKDKLDIVELIGEYVSLKPAGINHKGLCPFHHEKSPSFMVNRERQSWHCFGCGKGGDVFSFVQEIEGMDFVESLNYLANRSGVQLTDTKINQAESSQKTRIKDINAAAARFYHNFLMQMDLARPAREYLQQRGIKDAIIEDWQIGYVPDQWDLLTKYLLKKNFAIDDLIAAGLTIKKDNADATGQRGYYDRFRGRIMFPLWDIHDSVVGFTGRVLVETEHSGGKYVNTPQTLVYDKSRVIFGLNKAKKEIKAKNLVVMVEGQMDVIACHQAGMKNVVATSGTALTDMQIELLKRYATNLAIAFDADQAGQAAAKRVIDLAREAGCAVRVIRIPDGAGKDPDECLQKNPEVWQHAVANAQDVMEWLLEKSFFGRDLHNPRDRQTMVNELLTEVVRIPFAVERDHWLRIIANRLGEETSVLRENLQEIKRLEKIPKKPSLSSSEKPVTPNQANARSATGDRFEQLMERLLILVLRYPATARFLFSSPSAVVEAAFLDNSRLSSLYGFLKNQYTQNQETISIDALRHAQFRDSQSENIVEVLLLKGELDFFGLGEKEAQDEFRVLHETILSGLRKKMIQEIQGEMKLAEEAGDTVRLEELLSSFKKLSN